MSNKRVPHLLILGAGAKSAALHAYAATLRDLGIADVRVTSFERDRPAAHWCGGAAGLTDGRHPLGTSPLKDVSYPGSTIHGAAFDDALLRFSWIAFLRDEGRYTRWVDRGCPQPAHAEWAAYLRWCHTRASADIVNDTVTSVRPDDDGVVVDLADGASLRGDGFVYTGPGRPRSLLAPGQRHERVYDAGDFWSRGAGRSGALSGKVLIVGRGESAAAIVTQLAHAGSDVELTFLTRDGLLPTRDECFPTNTWYSDPADWRALPLDVRREIFRRGDRGVLSVAAQRALAETNVRWTCLRGRFVGATPTANEVTIEYDDHGQRRTASFDYAISAMGFDLQGAVSEQLDDAFGAPPNPSAWEEHIDASLRLPTRVGQVHVPGLAALAQGPGFPNLSCLATLAERVWTPYL